MNSPFRARREWRAGAGLLAALAASVALVVTGRPDNPPPAPSLGSQPGSQSGSQPGSAAELPTVAQAWPGAVRAELPLLTVAPEAFIDATTAIGVRSDGAVTRLLVETAAGVRRELRRVPAGGGTRFGTVRVTAGHLVWTESPPGRPVEIWAVDRGGGGSASVRNPRRLTADTGDMLLTGEPDDLAVADGRVHWTAAVEGAAATQLRSVALGGGAVRVREVPGEWWPAAWPWLVSAAGQPGAVLRDARTDRQIRVPATAAESISCTADWCRVQVQAAAGPVRIDVMRPDTSERRRVAGPEAQPAVAGVALLGRFEILAEETPAGADLIVHDLTSGRGVLAGRGAAGAYARDGILWWSTAGPGGGATVWQTLDLGSI